MTFHAYTASGPVGEGCSIFLAEDLQTAGKERFLPHAGEILTIQRPNHAPRSGKVTSASSKQIVAQFDRITMTLRRWRPGDPEPLGYDSSRIKGGKWVIEQMADQSPTG